MRSRAVRSRHCHRAGTSRTGIHIILEELDEIFEVTIVNLPAGDHFKPGYVAINPKSTIPALRRQDGSVLTADEYVAGTFSVADPVLFYVAFWAGKLKIALPATIAAHDRRMLARPAVQRVLREEGYNPALLGCKT